MTPLADADASPGGKGTSDKALRIYPELSHRTDLGRASGALEDRLHHPRFRSTDGSSGRR
jgi:hypothetical protein